MEIEVEDRFFTALSSVVAARLGASHPCSIAALTAARDPSTEHIDEAHAELARIDPGIRREIEAELELWMRGDL